ncbi:Predicted metal-binding protein [Thermosyntropha lipolytica DSM 11003]|uniref:Predicted metal-binding protein n=1 Tax=Thermosyntropha lipolytica DSM 11003 TaxID=1123382 RepID=A0A1M5S455_9FIRM|nr:Predicted metal-binding protein [Thermosyntropha lipolytica DSM 11003]
MDQYHLIRHLYLVEGMFQRGRSKFFAGYDENAEIIGFVTCGGCPGRRVLRLIESMKKHGLNVVHLSSCMLMETGYPKCPHYEEIKKTVENKGIRVVEGTHH